MPKLLEKVDSAFAGLGPRNHLRKLNETDRSLVCALLLVHTHRTKVGRSQRYEAVLGEKASKAAKDARKLADKLQADIFEGPLSQVLRPFLGEYESLPARLREFASRLTVLDLMGKPGRKQEAVTNLALIQACEYVRSKLGKVYYEDLAELFKAVVCPGNVDADFADTIRKKVERFEKHYPGEHFSPTRASQETVHRLLLHHSPLGTAHCRASMLEFSEGPLVAASEPGMPLACLVYVVEGKLRVDLGGVQETLALGDCAAIDTDMTVMWGSEGRDRCQVLMVNASTK